MDIPLCQNSHKPQLMLTGPEALPLYRSRPECFAGALAPDGATCAKWAEALDGLPPVKMHCSVLAEEALRSAIADYYKRMGKDPAEILGCDMDCAACHHEHDAHAH